MIISTAFFLAYPTLRNLTMIEWKNKDEVTEKFRIKQSICNQWKEIGLLLDIPMAVLQACETKYMRDPRECINEVLSHWLENPNETSDDYPVSWDGLYKLLEDAELTDVTLEVKKVLNACNTKI